MIGTDSERSRLPGAPGAAAGRAPAARTVVSGSGPAARLGWAALASPEDGGLSTGERYGRRGRRVGSALTSLPADERPRERLLRAGPGALTDGELLAIILRTGLVGETATELAHDLLRRHGGFWGLHAASVEQLSRRRGLKGAKVAQLKAALEIARRMREATPEERPQVSSPEAAFRLLQFGMAALEQEEMWVLLLDARNRVLGRPRPIYRGSLTSASVRVGELFREAVRENAASIVVAHNHPSGELTPSLEDVAVTRDIAAAGKLLDVEVLDHLVVSRHGYASLKHLGLGFA